MKESAVFGGKPVYIMLDKVYAVRFNFNVIYALEQCFGSMSAALNELLDVNKAVAAVIVFIQKLTGLDIKKINKFLNVNKYNELLEAIKTAIDRDFKSFGGCTTTSIMRNNKKTKKTAKYRKRPQNQCLRPLPIR